MKKLITWIVTAATLLICVSPVQAMASVHHQQYALQMSDHITQLNILNPPDWLE